MSEHSFSNYLHKPRVRIPLGPPTEPKRRYSALLQILMRIEDLQKYISAAKELTAIAG